MLQIEDEYTNKVDDFNEINETINTISSFNFETYKKPKTNNPDGLSWKKRLALFLLGFSYAGLFIVSLIVGISIAIFVEDKALYSILVESITYIILFAIMFAICFTERKYFANELKDPSKYTKGLVIGVCLIAVEFVLSVAIEIFYKPDVNANQAIVESLTKNYPTLMFIITCLIGPVCEELTYRVGLYGMLRKKNEIMGFIVAGLVFAAVHISFTDTTLLAELCAFPIYLSISYLLTLAYKKYGLAASLTAHIFINLISFISIMSL
ncbi:MAG: CPBP family intramembrane metalloprotease [Bacilli bacterium]|nr:CPBP family intramembrane metalloprotease [Bacilli bacterium]